jgi:hypothetical protein
MLGSVTPEATGSPPQKALILEVFEFRGRVVLFFAHPFSRTASPVSDLRPITPKTFGALAATFGLEHVFGSLTPTAKTVLDALDIPFNP